MISEEIWSFPGPHRFVSRLLNDIGKGQSILLYAPQYVSAFLAAKLRNTLRALEIPTDMVTVGLRPSEALLECLPVVDEPRTSLDALATCGRRVFVATVSDKDPLATWLQFLQEFSHRTAELDEHYRPSMVLLTDKTDCGLVPDVSLAVRTWREAWTETDSLAAADTFDTGPRPPRLNDKIAAHLIARLAIWDVDLARELSERRVELLTDPSLFLTREGLARGWSRDTECDENAGSVAYVSGVRMVHSSLLALRMNQDPQSSDELIRRRWHAQAVVLLPWIEEQRQVLSGVLARFIPKEAGEVRLLEVGPFAHFLRLSNAPLLQKRKLELLRQARNTLAHRSIVTYSELRSLSDAFERT